MKLLEKHPMIMIVIGILGISLSSILVKFSQAPSAVTASWRLLWTVLLMLPVVLAGRKHRDDLAHIGWKTLLQSGLSGVFLAIHFVVWFESLKHTSVASSTTIVCTEVIWVALGYCLFMGGKLSAKAIISILTAFLGSAMVAMADSRGDGLHLYGDLLSLIAAVAVAGYTLLGRLVRQHTSTTVYTFLVYATCAAVLVMICVWQKLDLFAYGVSSILIGLLLAVFSTILGHSIFSWCLKYFSPAFVSASKLCEPVAASVMAAILFREYPNLLQIIGSIFIIGSVYYYSWLERKQEVTS